MATVTSTLKMFDAITGPLKRITQAMNLVISTMRTMQNSTNQNVQMDRSLIAAQQQIAAAEAEIIRQIDRATNSQNRFNQSANRGKSTVESIAEELNKGGQAIIVLNQGLELLQKAWSGIKKGMDLADEMTSINTRLALVNDRLRTQSQWQQQVLDVANRTRASYKATADLVTKVGAGTQGVFKNDDQLLSFAERFNKTLAISGATATETEIAILQMSQALGSGVLQGDELRSLSEAAPVLMRILADGLGVARGQLKQMGADGELTAEKIVKAFENQSQQIDQMFEQIPMTFGGAMTIMENTLKTWFATLNQADGPLRNITSQVERLTAYLQSLEGQQFLNGVASGIATTIGWLIQLVEVAAQIYKFFSTHWNVIEPIIWGIVGAITAWRIAQWGLNIALTANPIGAIIMAIATLIGIIVAVTAYIIKLWKTNDDFAAGLLRTWNAVLNFFDQVPIFFMRIGYGIVNAFQWAKVKSLQLMEDLINGVIDRINELIDKMQGIPGLNLKAISKVELAAQAALDAESIRQAGEDQIAIMEENAAAKAAAREQKVLDFLNNRATKRAAEEAGKQAPPAPSIPSLFSPEAPNIDKVGEVGKIRDTVDISSEDLKTMRELAEMKNIQNFVTLTPTVQVTTGPISKETDVDTIIARIESSLTEQIASSAKGVYGIG